MKQHTRILLALSLLLLASLACNTLLTSAEPTAFAPPTVSQLQPPENSGGQILQSEDQVPRIDVEQAKAAYDSGQATIVDVRDTESYIEGHAAGSVSIPLDRFEININTIPLQKEEWIITYCT